MRCSDMRSLLTIASLAGLSSVLSPLSACSSSNGSPGSDAGPSSEASDDVGETDAAPEAADTSPDGPNASDADAGVCSGGTAIPTLTFDQQLAYECEREAGPFSNVGISTKECGGVIALIVQNGVDGQTLYLYDPSTKACLEVAGGYNGQNDCIVSVSGVPLATSCTYSEGYAYLGTGFAFVAACRTDGGAAGDSGADAGSADSGTRDAADAAGE